MSEQLKTNFFYATDELPSFMVFPKFLMELPISETSRILYMILLDRAKLSATNPQWTDEAGRVFLCYPISELSCAIRRSETTVKESLRSLEQAGLLTRQRQGIGRPNRLYLRLPVEQNSSQKTDAQAVEKVPTREPENFPYEGQISAPITDGNVARNNNYMSNNYLVKQLSNKTAPMGRYKNVYLSEEERNQLQREIPLLSEYIERLSAYMKQKHRRYSSHADTIRKWYYQDHPKPPERIYECREGESL